MIRKPNFFIVGAPKCATTAFHYYLQEHPNIFLPRQKEPHYFATDFRDEKEQRGYIRTEKEYIDMFRFAEDRHKAVGEASVFYLYSKEAIANILKFNSNAKLIAMVRNPIDLAPSFHSQMYFVLEEDQKDFETAWRLQARRLRGECIPKGCPDPVFLQYGALSSLGNQVKRMLDSASRDNVRIIVFDDFVESPLQVYRETLDFLDIPYDGRTSFPKVNENKEYKSRLFSAMLRRPPRFVNSFRKWLKRTLRIQGTGVWRFLNRINTRPTKREKLSAEMKAELADYFKDDVALLSEILNRDLSHWLRVE